MGGSENEKEKMIEEFSFCNQFVDMEGKERGNLKLSQGF